MIDLMTTAKVDINQLLLLTNYFLASLTFISTFTAIWGSDDRRRHSHSLLGLAFAASIGWMVLEYTLFGGVQNTMEGEALIIYRLWVAVVFLLGCLISIDYGRKS